MSLTVLRTSNQIMANIGPSLLEYIRSRQHGVRMMEGNKLGVHPRTAH
jgi:hypothetical protein